MALTSAVPGLFFPSNHWIPFSDKYRPGCSSNFSLFQSTSAANKERKIRKVALKLELTEFEQESHCNR